MEILLQVLDEIDDFVFMVCRRLLVWPARTRTRPV